MTPAMLLFKEKPKEYPSNAARCQIKVEFKFMQDLVKHLKKRLKTNHVVSLKPIPFLTGLREDTGQSPKTLKFTYSRLNSLMKTLEILGKGFLFCTKNCCSVLIVYFLELISFIIVVKFLCLETEVVKSNLKG